jgi:glycosyltransferase involved in cell wall biosynthesis
MKVSIITVSYNSESTIEKTLESVAIQDYPEIEHIIVDGASTDSTINVVSRFPHVSVVISEKDEGIYDAMNKGFSLASGNVVAFLNSDDYYAYPSVISDTVSLFAKKRVDYVYGNLTFLNDDGTFGRRWVCDGERYVNLDGVQLPHPSLFVRTEVLRSIDPVFDSSFRIAADLKQQLILVNTLKAQGVHIDKTLVHMAVGGASTAGISAYVRGWRESIRAYNDVYKTGGWLFTFKKILSKVRFLL